MQTLLVDRAISMSEFKKNPAAVLRQAEGRPVAVLSHNRVAFYLLEPPLFEALLQGLAQSRTAVSENRAGVSPRELMEALLSQAKTAAR